MNRRALITLLGGAAAAWPLAARAKQPERMRRIGVLMYWAADDAEGQTRVSAFAQGLNQLGWSDGRNLTMIVTSTIPAALAAKAATSTIPIVFNVAADPVEVGLVASLARPGGNATGVNNFVAELGAKQLGLLHELVPSARHIGLLANPTNPNFESVTKDVVAAAPAIGAQIDIARASDNHTIEAAFATLFRNRADALVVGADPFFTSRRVQLAILAMRYAIPTVYQLREYAEAGGLMSYGTSLAEAYRQLAVYTSRILKGANPSDLPVIQLAKFELVINLPTARAFGLDIPPTLLTVADEVIE